MRVVPPWSCDRPPLLPLRPSPLMPPPPPFPPQWISFFEANQPACAKPQHPDRVHHPQTTTHHPWTPRTERRRRAPRRPAPPPRAAARFPFILDTATIGCHPTPFHVGPSPRCRTRNCGADRRAPPHPPRLPLFMLAPAASLNERDIPFTACAVPFPRPVGRPVPPPLCSIHRSRPLTCRSPTQHSAAPLSPLRPRTAPPNSPCERVSPLPRYETPPPSHPQLIRLDKIKTACGSPSFPTACLRCRAGEPEPAFVFATQCPPQAPAPQQGPHSPVPVPFANPTSF